MKSLIITALLMSGSAAFADKHACIEKLTKNFTQDSRTLSVDTDTITVNGHENDHLAQARSIIRSVLSINGCNGDADINFGWSPQGRTKNNCQALVKDRSHSTVCYIESDIGFFFITRDLQTTANIIYNRWD